MFSATAPSIHRKEDMAREGTQRKIRTREQGGEKAKVGVGEGGGDREGR